MSGSLIYGSTFAKCFALTIYGWKWAWLVYDMRLIHIHKRSGDLWFIKETLLTGVRTHGFKYFLVYANFSFRGTYTFSKDSTQFFFMRTLDPTIFVDILNNISGRSQVRRKWPDMLSCLTWRIKLICGLILPFNSILCIIRVIFYLNMHKRLHFFILCIKLHCTSASDTVH